MKYIHTITPEDIGSFVIKKQCECCGAIIDSIFPRDLMGGIKAYDVGKKIYRTSPKEITPPVYQVENDEQLKKRLNHENSNS